MDMRCSQVNGAHLKVFLRSDSSAKGNIPELGTQGTLWILKSWAVLSFNKNLSNGYSSGAWLSVSLRYWSGRNLTAAKSAGVLESYVQLQGMAQRIWATGARKCFWGASTVLCSPSTQEPEILSWLCYGSALWLRESLCLNVPTSKRGHWCWLAL